MAVKPYPSNLIIFYIDERSLDNELTLAIRRSWTHIGDILVRPRPAASEDEPVCNYIHVMVKYGTRRYLPAGDAEADDNWNERVQHHLLASMRKIGNNCIAFNRQQRKTGAPEVPFDYIEFSLEGGKLALEFRLDSNSSLPTSCADIATDIRAALAAGTLGDPSPVRVRVPSRRSYALQAQAAAAAKAEEEARAAEEEAARQAAEAEEREEAEEKADERFMESPEMAAEVREEEKEAEEAEEKHSPLEVKPLTAEEWEALYGVPDVDFDIVYDVWEAVYADGTSREYDPEAGAFVEPAEQEAE